MLGRTLDSAGYQVAFAVDGGDALASIERSVPVLVVLDVAMPGVDGIAVSRRVRSRGLTTPILLLTARDGVDDRVRGLDSGADDYLVKPFATEELLACVRALLRRGHTPETVLAHGDLVLDLDGRRAARGDRRLELSVRESELLALLIRNARRVVSREQAVAEIWDGDAHGNVVDHY